MLCWTVVVVAAYFLDINVSLSIDGRVLSSPLWLVFVFCSCVCLLAKYSLKCWNKIVDFVSKKPDVYKGLEQLQIAFSGMLVKDLSGVKKALYKSKRHLGDIPMISWLEGQFSLMTGNTYEATSKFFKLSAEEKNTALGAYSLSQLAIENRSRREALHAIKVILKIHPEANTQIQTVIALCVKEGLFDDALSYLRKLDSCDREKIEGAIHYEQWCRNHDYKEIQKAFDRLKNIPRVAIACADEAINHGKTRYATKLLKKSFQKFPNKDVFDKYLALKRDSFSAARDLLNSVSESWVAYYEFAKILEIQEMNAQALNYFIKAYRCKNYELIANNIRILLQKVDDLSMFDIPNLDTATQVKFSWICAKCHHEAGMWQSLCPICSSIATYEFLEQSPNLPV
ncbi:MAG: hypothetical protein E7015_00285 [Alphaproteobacteria bacterium]|nr:hypothetical protein [Alphaproteobacteria bacterium]